MSQSRRLNSRRNMGHISPIRGFFDGEPDRPYLRIGVLVLMLAVMVHLVSSLVAINAVSDPSGQFEWDPLGAMTRVQTAAMLSAIIGAVAALLAIAGVISTVLGVVKFHSTCRAQMTSRRDEASP